VEGRRGLLQWKILMHNLIFWEFWKNLFRNSGVSVYNKIKKIIKKEEM